MEFVKTLLVSIFSLVAIVVLSESSIKYFIDFPSMIIVIVFPIVYMYSLYGCKAKKLFIYPLCPKCCDPDGGESANFYKVYARVVWLFAGIASIISLISMLSALDNTAYIGKLMAIILITILYAAIINLVIVVPCVKLAINKANSCELK